MPQSGKPLRGHQLARDGLGLPNMTDLFIFSRSAPLPGNTLSLRPASADETTMEGDLGLPILAPSSSQLIRPLFDFTDVASGIMQLQLWKNGALAKLQNFGLNPLGLQPILQTSVVYNLTDTWGLGLALQNSGVGVSLSVKVAIAFFP